MSPRRAAAVALAAGALLVTLLPARGEDPTDRLPADPAAWRRLDLETKWSAWRARPESTDRATWLAFLDAQEEDELLEWICVAEGWGGAGPILFRRRAAQWMRAAIWTLAARDSHSFEQAATTALETEPGLLLGYAARNPSVLDDAWLASTVERLKAAGTEPENPGALLPPLVPDEVYAALDAPESFDAAPGPAGIHPVERAIAAFERSNRRTARALRLLERLTGHPDVTLRTRACLAFTHVSPAEVPHATLLYRVADPAQPPAVREAALLAFGASDHPAIVAKLLEIAGDLEHPAWPVAVVRLVDHRDGFPSALAAHLPGLAANPARQQHLAAQAGRLRDALARSRPDDVAGAFAVALERAAWLSLTGHPLAAAYDRWLAESVDRFRSESATRATFARLAASYEPGARLLGAPSWRDPRRPPPTPDDLRSRVRSLAAALHGP
jgi:hypothetical protein